MTTTKATIGAVAATAAIIAATTIPATAASAAPAADGHVSTGDGDGDRTRRHRPPALQPWPVLKQGAEQRRGPGSRSARSSTCSTAHGAKLHRRRRASARQTKAGGGRVRARAPPDRRTASSAHDDLARPARHGPEAAAPARPCAPCRTRANFRNGRNGHSLQRGRPSTGRRRRPAVRAFQHAMAHGDPRLPGGRHRRPANLAGPGDRGPIGIGRLPVTWHADQPRAWPCAPAPRRRAQRRPIPCRPAP